MVRTILARLKPGAPQRVHIFLAALLWTGVGLMLITRGLFWLTGSGLLWLALPAVALGTAKSILALDKAARKSLDRISRLADGTCLGAVYSIKTWMLVLVMMVSGYALRHSSLPHALLGFVYMTIGWALLFSSRHAWYTWCAGT
jgi:hypothetical protein